MANTCIVCGEAAGSGEHIFPAALGGRRTNKNIYCTQHDNGYSSLVENLARQMEVFNARLGVIPDHSNDVKSVLGRDMHTGDELRLSVNQSSFTAPRVISYKQEGDGLHAKMSFDNPETMKRWIAQQKAKGFDVKPQHRLEKQSHILGDVRLDFDLGGPCGLGAVAYVTQTFLAQEFPDLVRTGDLTEFIAYTQAIAAVAKIRGRRGEPTDGQPDERLALVLKTLEAALEPWGGQAPVWWDIDPQPDTSTNAFEFGHRVTVGVDATDGQIFGRFSLFSSIHFGIRFGKSSSDVMTKTVTVDIDPMAAHPPNDIRKVQSASAMARVTPPPKPTMAPATSDADRNPEAIIAELMGRIEEYSLRKTAAKMHAELANYSTLPSIEGDQLIRRVVNEQAQRVWTLTKLVLQNYKPMAIQLNPALAEKIDLMTAHDQTSANGLSQMANSTLDLAKNVLATKMREDKDAGRLDESRIAELIGGGPGGAAILEAVMGPVVRKYTD